MYHMVNTSTTVRQYVRNFLHNASAVITTTWYTSLLHALPEKSHVLVVGIGTGAALFQNAHLLVAKDITVVGIDTDPDFVDQCAQSAALHGLQQTVRVRCTKLKAFKPIAGRFFTHVYFNGDCTAPQLPMLLRRCVDLLVDREDGRVFFTQLFQLEKNYLLEWIKPKLTVADNPLSRPVLYQDDFEECLYMAGLVIVDIQSLHDGLQVDDVRESRLVQARSSIYVTPIKATLN